MRNNLCFSVGVFGLFMHPLSFSPHTHMHSNTHFTTLEEDTRWWRVYFVYLSGCASWTRPINHKFNTGRDSVDSASGCKVKTLMYSTFANELQKSFFLFQLSFNRSTTVVCLYNVTFLYFYVWEKLHRGQDNFNWKIYEIYKCRKIEHKSTTNRS